MGATNVEASIQNVKNRIWRRIIVKAVVFAFWIVGLLAVTLQEGQGLLQGPYFRMLVIVLAVGVVSTVRDARRLRDEATLRKIAVEQSDERNVLITYKATRLAVVAMVCMLPIAVVALAYNGMHEAVNALCYATCLFLIAYVVSWFYLARSN